MTSRRHNGKSLPPRSRHYALGKRVQIMREASVLLVYWQHYCQIIALTDLVAQEAFHTTCTPSVTCSQGIPQVTSKYTDERLFQSFSFYLVSELSQSLCQNVSSSTKTGVRMLTSLNKICFLVSDWIIGFCINLGLMEMEILLSIY